MSLWSMLFGGSGGSGRIGGDEARALIKDEGAALIDVRSPAEFGGGHLLGAKNIPVDEVARRIDELPEDRPIVVYCRSGARSARAARVMRGHGRTVHDLGSKSAW
jgi:rhodanese-related sulfurtransferase